MRNNLKIIIGLLFISAVVGAAANRVPNFGIKPVATGSRPTGSEGDLFTDSTTHRLQYKDNSSWYNLMGPATTDTLTNKTIDADGSGNSITNIENADIKAAAAIALNKLAATTASRALVSDGSGFVSPATTTATEIGYVNGVTSSLCGINQSCTLTNKTIDADSNTLTNIENADIKAAAAIAVNKLAALTASRAVVSDGSGFLSAATTTSTEIGYVNGVTSAIQTQLDAKVAKSTLSAKGSLVTASAASTPCDLTPGSNDTVLTADSAQACGLKYASISSLSGAPHSSNELTNVGLSVTDSSGILTVALKQSDGSTNCSTGTSACKVGMRSSTATTGGYSQRSVTAALSQPLTVYTTLGLTTAVAGYLYIYAIDSDGAGTIKLGVSSQMWDEASLQSTVIESQTFTADSGTDVITSNSHGLQNGNAVYFTNSGGGLPGNTSTATVYYVTGKTANTFQIATTPDGTAVNMSSNGTGTHTWHVADASLVSDAVYTSKAIRLLGRTKVTQTTGSWGTPTETSLDPMFTGRQIVVGPLHSGTPTTTSASFADVSAPKLYVGLIPGKTGRYKIHANIVYAIGSASARVQYRMNAAIGSPTTVFIGWINHDSGAETGQVHTGNLHAIYWLTAGVPYFFNVQNNTSTGTLTTRTDLGGASGTSVVAEQMD